LNIKIGVKIVLVFNYGNSIKKLKQKIVLNHVKIVKNNVNYAAVFDSFFAN
jgi:hypothetical protein